MITEDRYQSVVSEGATVAAALPLFPSEASTAHQRELVKMKDRADAQKEVKQAADVAVTQTVSDVAEAKRKVHTAVDIVIACGVFAGIKAIGDLSDSRATFGDERLVPMLLDQVSKFEPVIEKATRHVLDAAFAELRQTTAKRDKALKTQQLETTELEVSVLGLVQATIAARAYLSENGWSPRPRTLMRPSAQESYNRQVARLAKRKIQLDAIAARAERRAQAKEAIRVARLQLAAASGRQESTSPAAMTVQ